MTDYLEFDSNSEEFVKRVREKEPLLFRAAREGFEVMTEEWANRMKTDHFTGYYPGKTRGLKLRTRHGALKKSVGGRVKGNKLANLRAVLRVGGKRAGYAPTQEYGDPDRTPTRATWMRIPLGPPGKALTATGRLRGKAVPRKQGTSKSGRPIYMTGYGRSFVIQKGGNLFIMARDRWKPRGKYKGNVLLFVLKKRVRIPPRLRAAREVIDVAGKNIDKIQVRFGKILMVGKG
jgi:hypothetical protein